MKIPRCSPLALAAGLLLTGVLTAAELPGARPEDAGLSPEKLQKASAAMHKRIKDGKMAGAVLLVARHGKIVLFEAEGVRDVDSGKPMEKDTIFRFFSMTKPITTVAALILWEEGRLDLDDPVAKYLPELKDVKVYVSGAGNDLKTVPPRRPMTIRDLMRHTSGLTYGIFGDTPVDKLYLKNQVFGPNITLPQMIDKLSKIPLLYQPGTHFHYSVSTDVLGRLVEVVSKKPLDEFFQERIFTPLDMKDTGFFVPKEKASRLAATHGLKDGKLIVVESPAKSRFLKKPVMLSGGAGLVSTARDYARFCQMLLNGGVLDGHRILRAKTVKEMTTNQLPAGAMPINLGAPIPGEGFGLGVAVRVALDRLAVAPVGEYGWGGVACTYFWVSPKDDLFVIALQQFSPFSTELEYLLKPLIYDAIKDRKK